MGNATLPSKSASHPSRRPSGRARGRGRPVSRREAHARHADGGFRRASERRHGLGTLRGGIADERGIALIAADGVWSDSRTRIGYAEPPRFAGRTAWRALVPAKDVAPEFREPFIHLWLGPDAHLVHYPVKSGSVINIVAIVPDTLGERRDDRLERARRPRRPAVALSPHAMGAAGARTARRAGSVAEMGALRPPAAAALDQRTVDAVRRCRPRHAAVPGAGRRHGDRGCRGAGAVARAHARRRRQRRCGPTRAVRRPRTWKVQRAAAHNGRVYHLTGAGRRCATARCARMGGKYLLRRYDWLYDWRPPEALSILLTEGSRHVSDHDRRQPAEARLARRAEQAVAAVARARARRSGRQARRDAARAQAAGGCRHRHRHRRRAVAPAFRPRLSRAGRRHRFRPARRDGHPQRSLQGDVPDGHRPAAAQGPRARRRGAPRARPYQAQAQIHPARPDDHRRHHRRRALRRPRRRWRWRSPSCSTRRRADWQRTASTSSSSTSRRSTSTWTRSAPGASRRCIAPSTGVSCTTAVHICYGYGIKANIDWKATLGAEWRQYEEIFPALAASRIDQVSVECINSQGADAAVGAAQRQGRAGRRDRCRDRRGRDAARRSPR